MMRKTNLTLIDMLLEQAENLTDSKLSAKQAEIEIKKAAALSKIAEEITRNEEVENHKLEAQADIFKAAADAGLQYNPQNEKEQFIALPNNTRKTGGYY